MVLTAQDLLWLLLPLAAASGWLAARLDHRRRQSKPFDLPSAYFRGLNYLLNEQPDKAIEVFTRVLEVNSDTVETHLALGNLFRRRGEVERAIRIHQNLIARPTLDRDQRAQALLELGQDYLKAGLYDRAENLFIELTENRAYNEQALRLLLDIYQKEKEWRQAIDACQKLARLSGKNYGSIIAHYYCELADAASAAGSHRDAMHLVKQAIAADKDCVRATILQGNIEAEQGRYRDAIRIWRRVEEQDIELLGEVAGRIAHAFRKLDDAAGLYEFFGALAERHDHVSVMLVLADIIQARDGVKAAEAFVVDWLRRHPTVEGLYRLIDISLWKAGERDKQDLFLLKHIIGELRSREAAYICQHCGFEGKTLHWLCPGCNQWGTIRPHREE